MVREMQSMMPVEGGYYHWVKQAFGPFTGFMSGWMNWVVSWVDVSIYPVWTAWYLGYFIPALRQGATIGGIEFSAAFLSWLVAAVLIMGISLPQYAWSPPVRVDYQLVGFDHDHPAHPDVGFGYLSLDYMGTLR